MTAIGPARVQAMGANLVAATPRGDAGGASAGFASALARRANQGPDALSGAPTPMSADDASRSLARAWGERYGTAPSPRTLALLWAQWAQETGRGQHMRGYNFGGLKATTPGEAAALLHTTEGHGADTRRIQARFRTYATALDGARDYVQTLAERYPEALAAARAGNATEFVQALARRRYFTGCPDVYARNVRSLAAEQEGTQANPGGAPQVDAPGWVVEGVLQAFRRNIGGD